MFGKFWRGKKTEEKSVFSSLRQTAGLLAGVAGKVRIFFFNVGMLLLGLILACHNIWINPLFPYGFTLIVIDVNSAEPDVQVNDKINPPNEDVC